MIIWTPAVLSVLYACVVFLYLHLFSAVERVSDGKALQKHAHYLKKKFSKHNKAVSIMSQKWYTETNP